jgi:hypothetical protein
LAGWGAAWFTQTVSLIAQGRLKPETDETPIYPFLLKAILGNLADFADSLTT